jgi:hypothetical protein
MFKHASPAVVACVAVPAAIAVVVVVFLFVPTRPKEGLSKVDALGKGARPMNERRSTRSSCPRSRSGTRSAASPAKLTRSNCGSGGRTFRNSNRSTSTPRR